MLNVVEKVKFGFEIINKKRTIEQHLPNSCYTYLTVATLT